MLMRYTYVVRVKVIVYKLLNPWLNNTWTYNWLTIMLYICVKFMLFFIFDSYFVLVISKR